MVEGGVLALGACGWHVAGHQYIAAGCGGFGPTAGGAVVGGGVGADGHGGGQKCEVDWTGCSSALIDGCECMFLRSFVGVIFIALRNRVCHPFGMTVCSESFTAERHYLALPIDRNSRLAHT